ncbi:MAG: ferrochelatase, partial [Lactobacillus iners]|nr:ferrochelatase [Lactobacillus iners]MCT7706874.1 ferrochelatase [Lactobacillus iners]
MQGLLLVNLGTPTSPTKNDIEKFILDFMGDPNVVTMPQWMWKPLLKHVILPIHIKKSIISYQKIWSQNGSPLRFYTEKITQQVQALLPDWQVKMAMTYGDPSINTTIQEMKNNGCDHLVLLPLYP